MMLTKAPKRDCILHCNISKESKKWLEATSANINRPMGHIIDEIINHARSQNIIKEEGKKKV